MNIAEYNRPRLGNAMSSAATDRRPAAQLPPAAAAPSVGSTSFFAIRPSGYRQACQYLRSSSSWAVQILRFLISERRYGPNLNS